ncbi:site-specific DNA-methyltransferase [Rickettsiales bacterium]|nr:site-specific DNA-methyltransferase [Rickettsiales bacterium]
MNINHKNKILAVLKNDNRLWNQDKTELNQTLLLDLIEKIDEKIIDLLLQEKDLREKFFVKIKDVFVFKTNDFRFFMEENKIYNSYTDYKNRIGLTDGKKFLKDTNDVVLDFPYKDCVLEGGQSTEEGEDVYFEWQEATYKDKLDENGNKIKDGNKNIKILDKEGYYQHKTAKRKEIFFNQTLAKDEIDRLYDPKALINWKRFSKDGEEEVKEIKRDEEGTIKDNLLIKGNNLIAMHTIKKQFAGKVKLIYIDPPYNTGNDGFKYNDSFNHSSWLTFMKNRLEIARELLRDDGVIFVQCDDHEQAYLKVLMDEIFKKSFLNTISVKSKVSSGASGGGEDKRIKKNIEYLHCYYKNTFVIFNDVFKETEIEAYINIMKHNKKSFKYTQILISKGKKEYFKTIKDGSGEDIKIYKHEEVITKTVSQIQKEENLSIKQVYKNYFSKIFTTTNPQSSIRQRVWDVVGSDDNFYSIEYKPKSGKNKGNITTQYYTGKQSVLLIWLSDTAFIDPKGNVVKKEKYGTFWDGIDYININKEGKVNFSSGKKPEQLLQRIIEISSEKGDIVLDYHLGSGTTCAVAHKMGRQYIGIEQMDYVETIACERIKKVIDGEQGGISKSVNWQGGGDFIYFELAKWNETAKEKILACESLKELIKFFDEMYERYFLNYNLKIKEFREKVIKEEEFKNLTLEEQKKMFIVMLDNNQMYVNKTEMVDSKYDIDEKSQNLTELFYKK